MSETGKSLDIDGLSIAERIALVEQIWESIAREQDNLEISAAQKDELDRRLEAYQAHPDEGSVWEDVKSRLQSEK